MNFGKSAHIILPLTTRTQLAEEDGLRAIIAAVRCKMLVCDDCGLKYEVIWNNDGMEPPCEFCPRCGSNALSEESDDE